MHAFTRLIREDMKPSLGVTEPGAIALAVARARSLAKGAIRSIILEVNSGIYKNAFTCGIPHTDETGNSFAAALGAVAGDWTKGLAALEGAGPREMEEARALVASGKVQVRLRGISSELYIKAVVTTDVDVAHVVIQDGHANIVQAVLNGETVFEKGQNVVEQKAGAKEAGSVAWYSLADFWQYAANVPLSEIEFIQEAYVLNLRLAEEGAASGCTTLCKKFIAENGGRLSSGDPLLSAHAMTAAAIEARVRGLAAPAMSITGSGNHGIICTMPLAALAQAENIPRESLLRATALAFLVTMYIKEYSGTLSAFCGCAIAAGTGAFVGWLALRNGTVEQAAMVVDNMASSLTGVICTGGNPACILKAAIAIDMGRKSVDLALAGLVVESRHGINGPTAEKTMRNMGRIASPGMEQTEKTIIEILEEKSCPSIP